MTRAKRKTRKVKEHMKNAADISYIAITKAFEILFIAADGTKDARKRKKSLLEVVYI